MNPSTVDRYAGPAAAIWQALHEGLPAIALDAVRTVLSTRTPDDELLYLAALACARMGALRDAEAWVDRIDRDRLPSGPLATDVWALAGRIAKQRFVAARERGRADGAQLAALAIDRYRRAFELSGSAYPAVNAATMAMLAGDGAQAAALATQALAAAPA